VHWAWDSTQDDWPCYWRHEGVYNESWRRSVPFRAAECKALSKLPVELSNFHHRQDIGVHLQEVGREYGTTTGRRRRCGWLDLIVMKHSCLINGYDSLNLTKLDVLDDLAEIKVAVKYTVNGEELFGFPGSYEPSRLKMLP
jgi:hypothetical protein